jgi:hypothetical protein
MKSARTATEQKAARTRFIKPPESWLKNRC